MLRGAPTGPAGGVASADLVERSRRGRRSSAPAAAPAVPTGSNRAAAPGGVPRRRLDSALLLYAQSAVTRAIYSHTREYLAVAEPGRGQEGRTAPGRRVFAAVRRAARAIILKCSVIKVLSEAREEKRQVSAKKAEVLWRRLSLQIPFVFDFVLDSAPGSPGAQAEHSAAVATKVAAELAKLLADFEGADALQLKFRNVATSFRESEASLRRFQASFSNNLAGFHELQSTIEKAAEEALRLMRLFECKVGDMREQLRTTLKSRGMRETTALSNDPTGVVNIDNSASPSIYKSASLSILETIASADEPISNACLDSSLNEEGFGEVYSGMEVVRDSVGSLRESLERDLCDRPMTALQTIAEEVNEQIASSPCKLGIFAAAESVSASAPFGKAKGAENGAGALTAESESESGRKPEIRGPAAVLLNAMQLFRPPSQTPGSQRPQSVGSIASIGPAVGSTVSQRVDSRTSMPQKPQGRSAASREARKASRGAVAATTRVPESSLVQLSTAKEAEATEEAMNSTQTKAARAGLRRDRSSASIASTVDSSSDVMSVRKTAAAAAATRRLGVQQVAAERIPQGRCSSRSASPLEKTSARSHAPLQGALMQRAESPQGQIIVAMVPDASLSHVSDRGDGRKSNGRANSIEEDTARPHDASDVECHAPFEPARNLAAAGSFLKVCSVAVALEVGSANPVECELTPSLGGHGLASITSIASMTAAMMPPHGGENSSDALVQHLGNVTRVQDGQKTRNVDSESASVSQAKGSVLEPSGDKSKLRGHVQFAPGVETRMAADVGHVVRGSMQSRSLELLASLPPEPGKGTGERKSPTLPRKRVDDFLTSLASPPFARRPEIAVDLSEIDTQGEAHAIAPLAKYTRAARLSSGLAVRSGREEGLPQPPTLPTWPAHFASSTSSALVVGKSKGPVRSRHGYGERSVTVGVSDGCQRSPLAAAGKSLLRQKSEPAIDLVAGRQRPLRVTHTRSMAAMAPPLGPPPGPSPISPPFERAARAAPREGLPVLDPRGSGTLAASGFPKRGGEGRHQQRLAKAFQTPIDTDDVRSQDRRGSWRKLA